MENFIFSAVIFMKVALTRALQKQPSRGVLRKRCPENMEQIYKRTHMP